jgi:hypothetical protein
LTQGFFLHLLEKCALVGVDRLKGKVGTSMSSLDVVALSLRQSFATG